MSHLYDVFVPIEDPELNKIMEIINIQSGQTFCDLGSGDGKVLIEAANRGAISHGIEYNPDLCTLTNQKITDLNISNVTVINDDFYTRDFSGYDIIFTNLADDICRALWDKLYQCHLQGSKVYMYLGVIGFGRCSSTCPPMLYDVPPEHTEVITFSLLDPPWFALAEEYGATHVEGKVYTHVLMTFK